MKKGSGEHLVSKPFEETEPKMKTMESNQTSPAEGQTGSVQLRHVVNQLVAGIVPATARHKSFLVNDIPTDLTLCANAETIAEVLGKLFNTLAVHTNQSCVRITAKTFSDVTLVQLRDQNSVNGYTIAQSLLEAQPIAEQIGGYVGVTSQRKHETTIVFSFPNLPIAA